MTNLDGRPPGQRRFSETTGIRQYDVKRFWPTWGDATAAAGLSPNSLNRARPEDEMLEMLAHLTRRLGKIPSYDQLVFECRIDERFPHYSTLIGHFENKDGIVRALVTWLENRAEFADIAALVATHKPRSSSGKPQAIMPDEPIVLSNSYIPPVVASLEALGRGDAGIVETCKRLGRDENAEFERRVGIAFEILGLSVEPMGQGYGRVADGIARCVSGGWAVIYDAKLRRDRYRLLTEDRKFREYIETHVPALRSGGLQRCYFAIVSSQFSESDIERAHELVRLCDIKSLVFVETSALTAMVESRLRNAASFDLNDVERLFTRTRILARADIKTR